MTDRFTHRQILLVLSGLMAGLFLAALDQTIVATALVRIDNEVGCTSSKMDCSMP